MEETIVPSIFDEMAEEAYFEHATQAQRLTNYLVDLIVYYSFNYLVFFGLGIIISLFGVPTDEITDLFSNKLFLYSLASVNLLLIYSVVEGITKGRTLGKMITKTTAVGSDLSPLTWKQAIVRSLYRIVPMEPFTALGGTPWHDKYSKTMVIKNRQKI